MAKKKADPIVEPEVPEREIKAAFTKKGDVWQIDAETGDGQGITARWSLEFTDGDAAQYLVDRLDAVIAHVLKNAMENAELAELDEHGQPSV